MGISVALQVGSIFNQAVRNNTAKRWNGVAVPRTTELDASNHCRYQVTSKNLDAAGCNGGPVLVIAGNRVFLCILHCCMAFGKLFVAFLEAQVGNHPPEVAGEVQKLCTTTGVACAWGAQRTRQGGGPQSVLGPGTECAPACIRRGGPHVASGCGAENIATHFVLANSGCTTPLVPTCCCCVSGTLLQGVGVALFVVPQIGL